jgi:hypothetical protein
MTGAPVSQQGLDVPADQQLICLTGARAELRPPHVLQPAVEVAAQCLFVHRHRDDLMQRPLELRELLV